jgi:hypothetical protein
MMPSYEIHLHPTIKYRMMLNECAQTLTLIDQAALKSWQKTFARRQYACAICISNADISRLGGSGLIDQAAPMRDGD